MRERWTRDQITQIRSLRDGEGLTWPEIARIMQTGWKRCASCYSYYKLNDNAIAARQANHHIPAIGPRVLNRIRPRVAERSHLNDTTSPSALSANPRARRLLTPLSADILARIAEQGITAGLFGDPPAGRSALDQKRGVVR